MTDTPDSERLFSALSDAIDEDRLEEILADLDVDCDDRTAEALSYVATEELTTITLEAAARANRRVRPLEPEDVAQVAEDRRCDPCDSRQREGLKPLYFGRGEGP